MINIHLGEILLEVFMKPMKLSQNRLEREIGVPLRRINGIVLGKFSVILVTIFFRISTPSSRAALSLSASAS